MQRNEKEKRKENKRIFPVSEFAGIILIAFSLAFLLALFSYDPLDQSLNTTSSARQIRNLIGPMGSSLADISLQFIGLFSYAAGLLLLCGGFAVFLGRFRLKVGFVRSAGTILLAFSLPVLVQLILARFNLFSYQPSGIAGKLLCQKLVSVFSLTGTYILMICVLLVSGLLLARISYAEVLASMAASALPILKKLGVMAWEGLSYGIELFGRLAVAGGKAAVRKARQLVLQAGRRREKEKEFVSEIPRTLGETLIGSDEALGPTQIGELGSDKALRWPSMVGEKAAGEEKPAGPLIVMPAAPVQEIKDEAGRGPQIVVPQVPKASFEDDEKKGGFKLFNPEAGFQFPPINLLDYKEPDPVDIDETRMRENAALLVQKLKDYGIDGEVKEIRPGPVVTMYEFLPKAGIKVSQIASREKDLMMALSAISVRIVAPIPGKGVAGIEVPNAKRQMVYMKEIIHAEEFRAKSSKLMLALGKDVEGFPVAINLAKLPHLLVAGATGTGKSVALNSFICSILYSATPDEVRFIMVDPKRTELSIYEGIPHLLLPVVYDPKQAAIALRWAVDEMERRFSLFQDMRVRDIGSYNATVERLLRDRSDSGEKPSSPSEPGRRPAVEIIDKTGDGILAQSEAPPAERPSQPPAERPSQPPVDVTDSAAEVEKLAHIVVVIDELANLMSVASRDVEAAIQRLAQAARAAGIHLIIATQRPSTDVITGTIKANFPSRVSFKVSTKVDSRTVLDENGAETLLGLGDMLFRPPDTPIFRCHGCFVSEEEVKKIVDFLKAQGSPVYDDSILARKGTDGEDEEAGKEDGYDEKWDDAVELVVRTRKASVSWLQRELKCGYNRAARMVERMEKEGIVGPLDGIRPREVLIPPPP